MSHGAAEFPEEMVWLWRDDNASKPSYTYELESVEKSKPPLRVSTTNREGQ
jgi:enterochelin esterase family protein